MNTNDKNLTEKTIVGDSIRAATDKIDEYGEALASKGDTLYNQSKQVKQKLSTELEHCCNHMMKYVKENPIQSSLIAAGVGFLLGKLIK